MAGADGLGEHEKKIPIVATPATADTSKAWLPIAVLNEVWDFMEGKTELSEANANRLTLLCVSAWPAVVTPDTTSALPVPTPTPDTSADKGKVCVITEPMRAAFTVFQQLFDFVTTPMIPFLKDEPQQTLLTIIGECLVHVQGIHTFWTKFDISKRFIMMQNLQKLHDHLIPACHDKKRKLWELVQLMAMWWNITIAPAVLQEFKFMCGHGSKSDSRERASRSRSVSHSKSPEAKRKPARKDAKPVQGGKADCPVCHKKHSKTVKGATCRRCGNANHRRVDCRANYDICALQIDAGHETKWKGMKCDKHVK